MSSARKSVAIIGCGIGLDHLREGFAALPELYEVRAICDLDVARLEAAADQYGIARATTDFDEILAMPDIDIVDICTPPSLHFRQSTEALHAGKHVICEKPQAASLDEVERLEIVVRESARSYLPIFQYRFDDGARKAKALIDSGLAGRLYVASAETFWSRGEAYYQSPWRGRWKGELGGVLMTHAIHIHDLLFHLIGPPASVFSRIATRVNPIEVDDCAVVSAVMPGGALVSTAATLGSHRQISRLRLMFENVTMESAQDPYAPGRDPWQFIAASPEIEAQIAEELARLPQYPARFEAMFSQFHAALAARACLPTDIGDVRRSTELATAIYRSARTGLDVPLPLTPAEDQGGWIDLV